MVSIVWFLSKVFTVFDCCWQWLPVSYKRKLVSTSNPDGKLFKWNWRSTALTLVFRAKIILEQLQGSEQFQIQSVDRQHSLHSCWWWMGRPWNRFVQSSMLKLKIEVKTVKFDFIILSTKKDFTCSDSNISNNSWE